MKTCEALRSEGFHSVSTIEFRLRNINYAEVQLDVPDFGSNESAAAAASATVSQSSTASAATGRDGCNSNGEAVVVRAHGEVDGGPAGAVTVEQMADDGDSGAPPAVVEAKGASSASAQDGAKVSPQEEASGVGNNGVMARECHDNASDAAAPSSEGLKPTEGAQAASPDSKKRAREEGGGSGSSAPGVDDEASRTGRGRNERLQPKAAIRAAEAAAEKAGGARKPPLKLVCAQPFPLMRGHTAFLTFATAPVSRQLGKAATAAATTAATGAAAAGATSGGVEGGSEGGRKASVAGDAESALNRNEGDTSGGGGGGSGDRMDVCEEGMDGKGKGKDTDVDKTDDTLGASASDVVPETPDSSSPAGR